MSRGNKVVLSYAPQTDVAIKPLTGWKTLPRKSDSLNHTVELTDSETINDSRIKTAGMPTSANAEGDVEVEFIKSVYDDLLEAVAFNAWKTNVLTFGGNVQKLFAIEKKYGDIGQYHYFKGMAVNKFNLSIPEKWFYRYELWLYGGRL
ncbi:phage tail tube protein [Moraxella boevrei]|uniref:phage tail tube protein n=1 Tax=Faucicola boevrei TaxID=346665 RepID=UPI003736AE33